MVTSVPPSLRWDWDLLAKRPRKVIYTKAVERKRRILWGILALFFAIICFSMQGSSFPRIHIESLPVTLPLLGVFLCVAIFSIVIQEASFGDEYRFLHEGVPHVGTIIRRSVSHMPPSATSTDALSTYQVTYCFSSSERVDTGTLMVTKAQYEELELDTPIIILVDPQDPYRFVPYDFLVNVALKP